MNNLIEQMKAGTITKWSSKHSADSVLVRDDSDAGGNVSFAWSTNGDRWYSSAYQTARDTAALAVGCAYGIGTRHDEVYQIGIYGKAE